MSLLPILEFPDPRLRKIAEPVENFDQPLQTLIDDMFETMYEAPGIGLAATQVDQHIQLIVMDISDDKSEPRVFINPEIESLDDELESYDEGCLSVPGYHESVTRPKNIKVTALDRHGDSLEIIDSGMLAICIQHEMDHLNGKLFVDYLSPLKRNRIRSKLEKAHKRQKR